MKQLAATLLGLIISATLNADIEITMTDASGRISTVSSNGEKARMQDGRDPTYMLLYLQSGNMEAVDTSRQEITELSDMHQVPAMMPGTAAASAIKVKLVDRGKGPAVAGYSTRKYDIDANGRHCGSILGSQKVYRMQGVREIFEVFSNLQRQSSRIAGGFRAMLDECVQADQQLAEHYDTIGAPLRVVDETGRLENEVTGINTRASKPSGYYDAPAGFRRTNMQQQMQQQPGMPPDALKSLEEAQKLLQQQFPQN